MVDKAKILAEMREYGKKVGYPNRISPKVFMEKHLNDCFKHLVAKNLVQISMYDVFRSAAVMQYQFWFMRNR